MYWIDAFGLGRNAIIGLLVASSLLMILVGKLLNKQKVNKKNRYHLVALDFLIIILVIVALSASSIGWKIEKTTVGPVKLSDVLIIREEGQPDYGPGQGTPVYTITVTNTFIPRQYELPAATACLYNADLKSPSYADVRWDIKGQESEFGPGAQTFEIVKGSKTATLKVWPQIRYKSKDVVVQRIAPEKPVPAQQESVETYDQLLLFLNEAGSRKYSAYADCYNLRAEDFERAIVVEVIP
jgi:hypothetical protein